MPNFGKAGNWLMGQTVEFCVRVRTFLNTDSVAARRHDSVGVFAVGAAASSRSFASSSRRYLLYHAHVHLWFMLATRSERVLKRIATVIELAKEVLVMLKHPVLSRFGSE